MSQGEPKVLGRYEITGEIGRGMMGVVYRAVDPVLGRTVALKTINIHLAGLDENGGAFEARFMTEARAAALLSHPAIVTVHDLGRDSHTETLYIALEYIEGRTLAEIVHQGGALPWRQALAIGGRIAGALDHAHQRGIIHRDVKPANIMILPGGEPKLMDFGIAKISAADLTAPGDFFGTPSYMSPEQAKGATIDGRSDVFSLGAVLYLALTGRRAFDAPSVPGIMARVVHEAAAPLARPDLPADVEYILERCLTKSPSSRYARARHLEEDIEDVLAGRPARHREGWPTAAATPAAVHRPAAAFTGDILINWVDRLGRRGLAAIGASLILIALGAAVLPRLGGTPVAIVPASVATPTPPPPTRAPETPAKETPAKETPAPARARAPVSLPASVPESVPAPVPARLEVSFRHPFRMGTVRVWVDGFLVLEQRVPGQVTRNFLAIKQRRGTFKAALDIAPGERVIHVEVDDGDAFRTSGRTRGTFASGEVRRLDAAVDSRMKKELLLVWGL